MAIDLKNKPIDSLKTMLKNHETKGETSSERYRAVLAELGSRSVGALSFDLTISVITKAAKGGEFVAYKTIADASNMTWNKANVAMTKHLLALNEHAQRKGWPMLSAIVVSKDHIKDGKMDPPTLAGFIKCARALNHEVTDEEAFVAEQQRLVFEAAKAGKLG